MMLLRSSGSFIPGIFGIESNSYLGLAIIYIALNAIHPQIVHPKEKESA
jgi:hypothetical protein